MVERGMRKFMVKPVIDDPGADGKGPVEPHEAGDGLDGEADVTVVGRHPLQLASLQPSSVAHGRPPNYILL